MHISGYHIYCSISFTMKIVDISRDFLEIDLSKYIDISALHCLQFRISYNEIIALNDQ